MSRFAEFMSRERRRLALWCPVIIGIGIWFYFLAPSEPSETALTLTIVTGVLLAVLLRRSGVLRPLFATGVCLCIGFSMASIRANLVAEPVLAEELDATIEGTIRSLSRSRTGAPRVMLDDVFIFGVAAEGSPRRVRISLLKKTEIEKVAIGDRISVYVHLSPPSPPAEPEGFDFRRRAWFEGLGATGFARGLAVNMGRAPRKGVLDRASLALARFRADLSGALIERLGPERGAFAAAITTGDRSGVSSETTEALRASNLQHLLAISGLHMGLLTGLIFVIVRFVLALSGRGALAWNAKKVAAGAAILAGLAYLAVAGASIATQRAFVMAAVLYGAVLVDRPAITLRALAVAATVILVLRPESLIDVGFQMSFAAATALIAFYDVVRVRFGESGEKTWTKQIAVYLVALALTSLVAGMATAPYAAFHFNRTSTVGLIANLGAVPIMGLWIMPMVIAAGVLSVVGLESLAFDAMGLGIDGVLWIARAVAAIDGAVVAVPAGPASSLALLTLGGIWLCLWRTRIRLAGLAGIAAAAVLWAQHPRPDLLVSPNARLIGVMTEDGRALDHEKAASYVAESWLRRDGEMVAQTEAGARFGLVRGPQIVETTLGDDWTVVAIYSRARSKPKTLATLCDANTILIAPRARRAPDGPCTFIGYNTLRDAGSISVSVDDGALSFTTSADMAGDRLWTRR